MLTILTTTEKFEEIQLLINSIERLDELVFLSERTDLAKDLKTLVIQDDRIHVPLDWYDTEPPYIFPDQPYTEENLLAFIFFKLGNHQRAFAYLNQESQLHQHLLIATHLQFNYEISEAMLSFCKNTSYHNSAIVSYYGVFESPIHFGTLKTQFYEAIKKAENDDVRVFTTKHFINLLLDFGEYAEAKKLAEDQLNIAVSDDAKFAMKAQLAQILTAQLQLPYKKEDLDELKQLQLECIAYFEHQGLYVQAGLLLIEAAEVANFGKNYIASKELINKAIQYFKQEDIPEFLGEAGLKKAVLLYTWSKDGNPQYYKAAINAFQDTLKVFKRDSHPKKFADIHHNLALIYSEIPVGPEEQQIWAAFCASSFKEVLAFYTKQDYPYEYAMVSHNYATALMDFPPAKVHDNLRKATELFEAALEIRTADEYPLERALTLLNFLELTWLTHNEDGTEERFKYEDMKAKAEEVLSLVSDESLIARAKHHLKELEKLKSLI